LAGVVGDPLKQVMALAGLSIGTTSETAMQKHLLAARVNAECLADDLVFQGLEGLRGHEETEAREMLGEVREALERDEIQVPLAATVRDVALRAQQWMRGRRRLPTPLPERPEGEVVVGSGVATTVGEMEAERARMLEAVKSAGPEGRLVLSYSWRVVKRKPPMA
jgi:hypothetical protein